jgi:hypothetical protein
VLRASAPGHNRRQPELHKLAAMAAGVSEALREHGVADPGASILGRLRFAQRGNVSGESVGSDPERDSMGS